MEGAAQELARRRLLAHALLTAGVLGAAAFVVWPPESSAWYPVCPVARYLHLQCPGCGATRALAALLRGHLRDALRYNNLFVAVLPLLVAGLLQCYRRAVRPGSFDWPRIPAGLTYGLLAAAAIFMVVRNGLVEGL